MIREASVFPRLPVCILPAMPRFDFRCTACDHHFEDSIPFGSKTLPPCPACGKKKTEKMLSAPMGIQFKGSGFYKTDSKTSSAPAKPAPEKTPEPAKPAADAPKPATKTESSAA